METQTKPVMFENLSNFDLLWEYQALTNFFNAVYPSMTEIDSNHLQAAKVSFKIERMQKLILERMVKTEE